MAARLCSAGSSSQADSNSCHCAHRAWVAVPAVLLRVLIHEKPARIVGVCVGVMTPFQEPTRNPFVPAEFTRRTRDPPPTRTFHCSSKFRPKLTAPARPSILPSCQLRPIAPALWLIGAGPGVAGKAFLATPTLICSASPRNYGTHAEDEPPASSIDPVPRVPSVIGHGTTECKEVPHLLILDVLLVCQQQRFAFQTKRSFHRCGLYILRHNWSVTGRGSPKGAINAMAGVAPPPCASACIRDRWPHTLLETFEVGWWWSKIMTWYAGVREHASVLS